MVQPGFQILDFGVFDSAAAFPRAGVSRVRTVRRFELELYTEELPGICCMDGAEYPQQRGLFLCGKPGQRRFSKLPVRSLYLHLNTEDPGLKALLLDMPDACILPDPSGAERLFRELAAFPEPTTPEDALLLGSAVTRLVALLSKAVRLARQEGGRGSTQQQRILEETVSYICANPGASLSLEVLAARAGFSPSHFHRMFTARFGMPLHEYVLQQRIEAACAALRADSMSLSDLAAACGFSSQAHFSSRFKKATGMTPRQYRQSMLSRLEV